MAEHEMEGISYSTVCDYVRLRRPEIRVAAGRAPSRMFIPQTHRPGVDAEVDFGDVIVLLRGERTRCYLFTFRMSYSGKAVHRVFASCGQEAFLEGHLHAFSVLGGYVGDQLFRGPVLPVRMVAPVEELGWPGSRSWHDVSMPRGTPQHRSGTPWSTTTWSSWRPAVGRTPCWPPPTT
ncbi:hypothetical protein ACW4TU_44360 [Streptomyces sp. QTS52]